MADISQEIAAIESAVYGEQVRSSIKNAIIKVNEAAGSGSYVSYGSVQDLSVVEKRNARNNIDSAGNEVVKDYITANGGAIPIDTEWYPNTAFKYKSDNTVEIGANNDYAGAIISCSPGDIFVLSCSAEPINDYFCYLFAGAYDKVVGREVDSSQSVRNKKIVAPNGAIHLYVNALKSSHYSISKGKPLEDMIPDPLRNASPSVSRFPDNFITIEDSGGFVADALHFYVDPTQTGSGTPSTSNVRPIVGYETLNGFVAGKNLIKWPSLSYKSRNGISYSLGNDENVLTMKGTVNSASGSTCYSSLRNAYSSLPLGPYPAGTYTLTCYDFVGASSNDEIAVKIIYDDDTVLYSSQRISSNSSQTATGISWPTTFTATRQFKIGFIVRLSYHSAINCSAKIQLQEGEFSSVHENSSLNHIVFPVPTDAGTIYGCEIDVGNGKLYVTHKKITMDGVTSGAKVTAKGSATLANTNYYFGLSDGYLFGKDSGWVYGSELSANGFLCSNLPYVTSGSETTEEPSIAAYIGASGTMLQPRIVFPPNTTIASVEDCNSWLAGLHSAGTPVEFTYKLTTPVEYDIDVAMPVVPRGIANAWCGEGETSLNYRADIYTKLYNMITELQAMVLENINNA